MLDLFNFNIGGGSRGGYSGTAYRPSVATPVNPPRARNSAEQKFAKSLANSLNVLSFDFSTFAYAFVQHAPGPVIRNFFRLFEAVGNVLIERVNLGISNNDDEYECGITAARIQDALENYNSDA